MKTMWVAFIVSGIIAIGANYGLDFAGFGADERNLGADVRLN